LSYALVLVCHPCDAILLLSIVWNDNLNTEVRKSSREIHTNVPASDYYTESLRQFEAAEPGDDVFVRWAYCGNYAEIGAKLSDYFKTG